ncbi:uncharacterized protein LOC143280040 isoform X2 [Babylonia areolata]
MCPRMAEGQKARVMMILLSAMTTTFPQLCTSQLSIKKWATIMGESDNGTKPLEYAVGTNVTIRCKFNPDLHDVTKMTLRIGTGDDTPDVIAVGNDTIKTTLPYAKATNNERIQCLEGSTLLGANTLCVGYGPSPEMSVSCRLHPKEKLQCRVHTEQDQESLCNVMWTLSLWKTSNWTAFPGLEPEGHFSVSQPVDWLLDPSYPLLHIYGPITVRAIAKNGIGTANAIFTFIPVHYVVPGPVVDLGVHNDVTDPGRLQVTWDHNPALGVFICEGMKGLHYRILVHSALGCQQRTMAVNCSYQYREKQRVQFTDLIPYTSYNVTVTPMNSPQNISGLPESAVNRTSQSRPLRAPTIVAWSASSSSSAGVVVYWKTLGPRYRGGPIVAYDVTVTSSAVVTSYGFNVSEDLVREEKQFVTSPRVLEGCSTECRVSVALSTKAGASDPASVRIPSRLRGMKAPIVYTEKARNGSYIVSWEGDVNVTSVAWCYGISFASDSSLIQCQTDVEEDEVERPEVQKKLLPKHLFNQNQRCQRCRLHFAVRLQDPSSDNDTNSDYNFDYDADFDDDGDDDNIADLDSGSELDDADADFTNGTGFRNSTDGGSKSDPIRRSGSENGPECVSHGLGSSPERTAKGLALRRSPIRARANSRANQSHSLDYDSTALNSSAEVGSEPSVGYGEDWDEEFGIGRLVWNQCHYEEYGVAPLAEVKVRPETMTPGTVDVTVQSLCSRTDHPAGRPLLAQLTHGTAPTNCSAAAVLGATNISLQAHTGGAMRGELRLTNLKRGNNYTLCVKLLSHRGWGDWHKEWFLYKNLAVDSAFSALAAVLSGVAVLVVVVVGCCVRWFCGNLREKRKRFSKLDFTLQNGNVLSAGNGASATAQLRFPVSESCLESEVALVPTTSRQQGSMSSTDSAFEENSARSDDFIGPTANREPQATEPAPMRPPPKTMTSGGAGDDEEEVEKDPLLGSAGDTVPGAGRGRFIPNLRPVPELDRGTSPPKPLGLGQGPPKPSWSWTSSSSFSSDSDSENSSEEHVQTCVHGRRLGKEDKQQNEKLSGQDKKRFQWYESSKQPALTDKREEDSEFQYVNADSPSHPYTLWHEDPESPSVHTPLCEAGSKTADTDKSLEGPDGTATSPCSCGSSAGPRHAKHVFLSPQLDSCCVLYCQTDTDCSECFPTRKTGQGERCCIPVEQALADDLEGGSSYSPLEHVVETIVSFVPTQRAASDVSCVPMDQAGEQDNAYIPMGQDSADNEPYTPMDDFLVDNDSSVSMEEASAENSSYVPL